MGQTNTFIFLAGLFACFLASTGCPSASDIPSGCSCSQSQLTCNGSSPVLSSQLTINQCSDPMLLTLTINTGSFPSTQQYHVGGPDTVSTCNTVAGIQITAVYSRNATHLMFRATGIYQGDIAVSIIPEVTLPLTQHMCMCQSLQSIASNFLSSGINPLFASFQHNCSNNDDCSGITCNIQFSGSGTTLLITVDPCSESLLLTIASQNILINQTEDKALSLGSTSITIHAILINANYSMNISATINLSGFPVTIPVVSNNQLLLDRSSCGSNIVYYPGLIILNAICSNNPVTPPTTNPGGTPTGPISPPTAKPGGTPTVGAIAGSVSVILLLGLVVMVIAAVLIGLYVRKKKRAAAVYSFSQLTDDGDDDDDEGI